MLFFSSLSGLRIHAGLGNQSGRVLRVDKFLFARASLSFALVAWFRLTCRAALRAAEGGVRALDWAGLNT